MRVTDDGKRIACAHHSHRCLCVCTLRLAQEAAGGEVTKEEKFADVGAREEYADEPQK
jgi:hypothetical protein